MEENAQSEKERERIEKELVEKEYLEKIELLHLLDNLVAELTEMNRALRWVEMGGLGEAATQLREVRRNLAEKFAY